MANLNDFGFGFDTNTAPAPDTFAPLPAGKYFAQVIDSEVKDTRAGTGKYIAFTFEIVDGPAAGRKVFWNANIVNPNPTAVEIGLKQLSGLCRAVGFTGQLTNTEDLHGKPMRVTLTVKASEEFGDRNEIKGFELIPPGKGPVAPAAPAAEDIPAWEAPTAAKATAKAMF